MKQKWKTALKCLAGALAALAALNLFCAWYYNPTAYEWDEARATDTIRTPGAFTSRATEGFAWMRMDENGYNNASAPGEEGVSVLMMGSSHAEALNVMQDESAAARLNEMLAADGARGMVYNIGVSSHTLPRCVANLDRALERFQPADYVVLETQDVSFPLASLAAALEDSFERLPRTDVPLPDWITGQPLVRALYRQIASLRGGEAALADEGFSFELTEETYETYVGWLGFWLNEARKTAEAHGVGLIIYYHPHSRFRRTEARRPIRPRCTRRRSPRPRSAWGSSIWTSRRTFWKPTRTRASYRTASPTPRRARATSTPTGTRSSRGRCTGRFAGKARREHELCERGLPDPVRRDAAEPADRAPAARAAVDSAGGQLCVLRLVGLAVLLFDVRADARRLPDGAGHGALAPAPPRAVRARRRRAAGRAGGVQVRRLLRRIVLRAVRAGAAGRARHHPAGRHFVLHLSEPELYDRRLPRQAARLPRSDAVFAVHRVLPAAGRGANRQGGRLPAAARGGPPADARRRVGTG